MHGVFSCGGGRVFFRERTTRVQQPGAAQRSYFRRRRAINADTTLPPHGKLRRGINEKRTAAQGIRQHQSQLPKPFGLWKIYDTRYGNLPGTVERKEIVVLDYCAAGGTWLYIVFYSGVVVRCEVLIVQRYGTENSILISILISANNAKTDAELRAAPVFFIENNLLDQYLLTTALDESIRAVVKTGNAEIPGTKRNIV